MLDEKPKMVEDPSGKLGKKVAVYWDTAKRILNDPSAFLGSLLDYNRDNIPEAIIQKISPFMALEEFKPEHVAKVASRHAFLPTEPFSFWGWGEVVVLPTRKPKMTHRDLSWLQKVSCFLDKY